MNTQKKTPLMKILDRIENGGFGSCKPHIIAEWIYNEELLHEEEEFIKDVYWAGKRDTPANSTQVDIWWDRIFGQRTKSSGQIRAEQEKKQLKK